MRLGVRLGSAAVLLALVAGALAVRGPLLDALAAAAVAVACREYAVLMRRCGAEPLPWLLYPLALFLLLRHAYPTSWPVLEYGLGAAVVVGLIGTLARPREAIRRGMVAWASAVAGALYLGLTLGFLLIVANRPDHVAVWTGYTPLVAAHPHAAQWLVAVALGSAMVGDTAALFAGSALGRHRFFPAISPRKTVEGAIGSLLGTVLTWALAAPPLAAIPVSHAVVLGVVVSLVAMGGDLAESALKRAAGVKDSSGLIPGHGGLLDRLDALLLVGPVLYAYVAVTGLP